MGGGGKRVVPDGRTRQAHYIGTASKPQAQPSAIGLEDHTGCSIGQWVDAHVKRHCVKMTKPVQQKSQTWKAQTSSPQEYANWVRKELSRRHEVKEFQQGSKLGIKVQSSAGIIPKYRYRSTVSQTRTIARSDTIISMKVCQT